MKIARINIVESII